jgi:hypothetical protein
MTNVKKPPYEFGQINFDLPTWLGNQFRLCHFDLKND